jgi:hypothetical protein
LFLAYSQKVEIVLTPGPHTFAIIDKKDPLNEAITASFELNIAAGEADLIVQGKGTQFSIMELSEEALAEARQAEAESAAAEAERAAREAEEKLAAIRREFPLADSRKPGPGESVLEIKLDWVAALGITVPFAIDGKPVAELENGDSVRLIIPDGKHTISAQDNRWTENFTAKSNQIFATLKQFMWYHFDIEEKPLN